MPENEDPATDLLLPPDGLGNFGVRTTSKPVPDTTVEAPVNDPEADGNGEPANPKRSIPKRTKPAVFIDLYTPPPLDYPRRPLLLQEELIPQYTHLKVLNSSTKLNRLEERLRISHLYLQQLFEVYLSTLRRLENDHKQRYHETLIEINKFGKNHPEYELHWPKSVLQARTRRRTQWEEILHSLADHSGVVNPNGTADRL